MTRLSKIYLLIPFFGTLLFVFTYYIATLYYPGGSQVNEDATGFSWRNNYWCNLLNDTAINGQTNTAKPIAILAMLVLCISLSFFWIIIPRLMSIPYKLKVIIKLCGTFAMMIAFFLFTGFYHDAIINTACVFGMIATAGILIGLYQNKLKKLFAFGIFNLFLVAVNNYVYYTKELIVYLPVVQKISFAAFLVWICCINIKLYNNTKLKSKTGIIRTGNQ